MNCFPCFNRNKDSDGSTSKKDQPPAGTPTEVPDSSSVQTFNFRELAMATKNFRQECLLGEGGFGRVFKGTLQASGQVVAVKQLDRNGMQGNKEFTVEVMKLSHLKHPNLVNLIGYCADGDQRVLVYEYMPLGSLEDHLFGDGPEKKPLDWSTRMKIASSAAQGLEYLHERANPPVMYGDFKPSNVLLNEDFEPKLADVGLSKLGAGDGTNQPSSRVMDTFGYSAPEYTRGGEVTLKSDVYCFGIVLLELITGRRAIDTTRPTDEQNLVTWAQTFFRDPKRFPEMADPRLNKWFPATALNQAVGIAAMCLQDEPMVRPLISDVNAVLSCISMIPNDQPQAFAPPQQQMEYKNEVKQDKSSSESHSSSSSDSEGESLENTHSSQVSDGESGSGSDSESDDVDDDDDYQSEDEESTCNSDGDSPVNKERTGVDKIRSRQTSRRKSKRVSSRMSSQRKKGSSRRTVVTFKEPSLSSRYSASGKSDMKESSSGSSSSEKSTSESDDNEQIQSRENGSSSTQQKRPKRRGTSESVFQLENGGHFDRNSTEPAQLRGMLTPDEV